MRYQNGALPTSKGYTGQRSDASTSGLDYYNARYYDPVAGQFTSADTTLAGGLNRYGYVGGSPETFGDPSGHSLVMHDESGVEGTLASEESGAIPEVFNRAFAGEPDTALDPTMPAPGTTVSTTDASTGMTSSYVENADGSLTVTQTSGNRFVRLDTYGAGDAGYKTLLALLLSSSNAVNASAVARAPHVRHQNNAFTAENDRSAPAPTVTSPSNSSSGEGSATASAPQSATDGAGARQGGGSDRPYVIGETMSRVLDYASAHDVRYYSPWMQGAKNSLVVRNATWLLW